MNLYSIKLDDTPPLKLVKYGLKYSAGKYYDFIHHLTGLPRKLIIINCPARSGSTLLTNLLCNHKDICGYGETKIAYKSERSVQKLIHKIYWANRKLWISEIYALDKIVFNRLLPDLSVFDNFDVNWIFLLRDPIASVKSYMEYHGKTESKALPVYVRRVKKIEEDAKKLCKQHQCLFLTYEQLIHQPVDTLLIISNSLGLNENLNPYYKLSQASLRHKSSGDKSEYIDTGRVISKPRKHKAKISDGGINEARQAFQHCKAVLENFCFGIDSHIKEN